MGTFLASIRDGVTLYDAPSALQLPFWEALDFVDSYFHLLLNDRYVVASNALLLSGFCAAVLFLGRFAKIASDLRR